MASKIMYWIPRVLTIIFILFMTMFSLDVFGGDESIGAKMLGFLIHNIPVLIIIAILIIAWRQEIIGGALLMLAALTGTHFYHSFAGNPWSLVVLAPFFFTGILFILHQVLFPGKKKV